MEKITSVAQLVSVKQRNINSSTTPDSRLTDEPVRVKVAMATCGIASGAKETMEYFITELNRQGINAVVTQTGCMSYCYAEPTVEITLPQHDPVVFGFVNSAKAQEIIDRYIVRHELVDGIIPASYKTV
jgi:NADP-reducing hydrogenase subunit HndB